MSEKRRRITHFFKLRSLFSFDRPPANTALEVFFIYSSLYILFATYFSFMESINSLYARRAYKACEKIIDVWDDNPIHLYSLVEEDPVFLAIHEVSLVSMREGLDPKYFLLFFKNVFRDYSDAQTKFSHAFKQFYFHVCLYALVFQFSFSYFFREGPLWLVFMTVLLNLILYYLAPKSLLFTKTSVLISMSVCSFDLSSSTEATNNNELTLSRALVEDDLKKYEHQARRLRSYFSILELFFCGPLLLIFCAYFFINKADFPAF